MKILTSIISHASAENKLNACLNTWIKNITPPHDYFIAGDGYLTNKYDKCINCSSIMGEQRSRLPLKTWNSINYALTQDFDYYHKCDDDSYVRFDRLIQFLNNFDSNKALYIGYTISNPFRYALGFSYVLSRKAIEQSYLFLQRELCESSDISEDRCVGSAMQLSNIDAYTSKLFYCPNFKLPAEEAYSLSIKNLQKESIVATVHQQSVDFINECHHKIQS